ncbi:related to FAP7 - involved in the oxidative stress response [Ustilago sp. UG-2017b]|nr:related to FAP7 - involved in the oxidative stress response [Ustilago sp. UG-2017b]
MVRSYPNIVITGTPGTGKSTHSSLLASTYTRSGCSTRHPLRQIDIGALVKSEGFYTEYLQEWQSYQVDEDQLLDHLEPLTGNKAPEPLGSQHFNQHDLQAAKHSQESEERGGLILDWHTCDVWPERWIDLVVVLRCDHGVLWERLEKRGYPINKIQENNEAEIMGVVADDARQSYPEEAVVELTSEETGHVEQNVERIVQWITVWRQARGLE